MNRIHAAMLAVAGPALAAPAFAQSQSNVQLGAPSSQFYGGLDYLLWSMQGAPVPVPLISTGPIGTTHHGFASSPDTTILYGAPHAPARGGNDTQNLPSFSGTRVTLGAWLDGAQRYALEASGFVLARRGAGFTIFSNQNGLPIVGIPVYNTIPYTPGGGRAGGLPPAEDSLPASLPSESDRFDGNAGVFAGGIKVTNTLQLWGADLTGVALLYRDLAFDLSGLAGFKHLNLSERFGLLYQSWGVSGVYTGEYGAAFDSFKTTNQFYGGTLGLRARYLWGRWSAELTGKLGIGASRETLSVSGGFSAFNFPSRGYNSGREGVFAQPANEGRFSSTRFALVPEGQVKIGYDITPSMRLTVGYDVLYDTDVIRPGDQINRNIPKGQTFNQGQTAPSTTSPERLFRTTDFLAHGFNAGVTIRF